MSADLSPSSQTPSLNEAGASSPDQAQQGASSPSPAHLLDVLERLSAGDDRLLGHMTLAGRAGRIADWPEWVSPAVVDAWARRGVERPWVHQREALDAVREGLDVVLATGTGSGKSLAAWTPILSDLVEAEDSSSDGPVLGSDEGSGGRPAGLAHGAARPGQHTQRYRSERGPGREPRPRR